MIKQLTNLYKFNISCYVRSRISHATINNENSLYTAKAHLGLFLHSAYEHPMTTRNEIGSLNYLLAVHLLATIFQGSDLLAQTVNEHPCAFHHCL